MQDEQIKDKKISTIVLVTIVVCIIVACILGIYYYQSGDNTFSQPTQTTHPKTIIRTVKIIKRVAPDGSILDEKIDNSEETNATQEPTLANNEEDEFDKEYAKYLAQTTIADVPAKPREEIAPAQIQAPTIPTTVPATQVNESVSLWGKLKNWIASFFSSEDEGSQTKKNTPEIEKMLADLEANILKVQNNFLTYTEANGVAYIDHANKPEQLESFGIYIYLGVTPDNYTFHRTIIRYSGDKEIGLQSILVQPAMGDHALIVDATKDVLQEKQTTKFNEWVDLPPTQENNNLLNMIVSSDEVKVTFLGRNGNVEWKVPAEDMATLRESLYFYNLLKEKEELLK